ncbi:uncharacterized protein LOC124267314 [Haliotis rubra]|uniref:uncharacterized protein LOC124267314 n=1 Tax=Haliotis rubra TaxID=36100 RepID=UPI001EE5EBDA|nr:uncharacterized protein LOC124267314 [Haliotis rubra]
MWKQRERKCATFLNKCLRQIPRIKWFDKVSNLDLWEAANEDQVSAQIKRQKWRWIGHTLRKHNTNITRQALDWNPHGKRKRGRPKQTWRRSLEKELRETGLTWEATKSIASDRQAFEDNC